MGRIVLKHRFNLELNGAIYFYATFAQFTFEGKSWILYVK